MVNCTSTLAGQLSALTHDEQARPRRSYVHRAQYQSATNNSAVIIIIIMIINRNHLHVQQKLLISQDIVLALSSVVFLAVC